MYMWGEQILFDYEKDLREIIKIDLEKVPMRVSKT